jgi:hypothetical protein
MPIPRVEVIAFAGPCRCLVASLVAVATAILCASAVAGICPGDCDGNGVVEVDEIVVGVNIALGEADLLACTRFDTDGDGRVTVDELLVAVGAALRGCPPPQEFPIGAYFWPDHAFGQTGSALRDLADFGLNTVVAYYEYVKPDVPAFSGQPDCAGLVQEAAAHAVDFFIGAPHGDLLRRLDDAALSQRLQATVNCAGASPHYRGWMIDEPELIGYDVELMQRVVEALRRIDRLGHIWVNFNPYASEEQVRGLGSGADIVGFDVYPIREGDGSAQANRPLTDVGLMAQRARELAPAGAQVWMIVQAFGYSDLPAEGGRGRRPTPEELRFMVYDALAGGAGGIVFFGSHQLRNTIRLDDPVWNEGVRRVVRELRSIGPTLLAGERTGGAFAEPAGVEVFTVRSSTRELIVARNTTAAALDAVLHFEAIIAEAVEIFDERRVFLTGSELHDSFDPYGVHVYEVLR